MNVNNLLKPIIIGQTITSKVGHSTLYIALSNEATELSHNKAQWRFLQYKNKFKK